MSRGVAGRDEVFGDFVIATALLDRVLHHAVVVQIEGAIYHLRHHADLVPSISAPKLSSTGEAVPSIASAALKETGGNPGNRADQNDRCERAEIEPHAPHRLAGEDAADA